MKMVLHILSKDIRGLRWEIVATVALTLMTVALELPGRFTSMKDLGQFWSQPALVFAWILLVLRVVQRDGLVGTEHDWLTRPVRRWQLGAAKALFVLLFIVAPLAIRDSIVVAANGFPVLEYLPGLAWSLAAVCGVFLLPAAALGVVTRTIPQALMGVLGLAFAAALTARQGSEWIGVDWVPLGLAAALGAVFAAVVVWLQYSRRWTVAARVLAVAGAVAAVCVPLVLPWRAAFFCQRLFATEEVDAGRILVRLAENRLSPRLGRFDTGSNVEVHFPLEVTGAPAGYKLRVLRVTASAGTAGETYRGQRFRGPQPPEGGASYGLTVKMRRRDDPMRNNDPIRLRGRVYLALLAPRAKQEFSYEKQRQIVPGVGICEANLDRIPVFYCLTPFRTPTETRVTFQAKDTEQGGPWAVLAALSSLSPFPFEFSVAPLRGAVAVIERPDYSGKMAVVDGLAGGRITYESWAPVAYLEREFDIEERVLDDVPTR